MLIFFHLFIVIIIHGLYMTYALKICLFDYCNVYPYTKNIKPYLFSDLVRPIADFYYLKVKGLHFPLFIFDVSLPVIYNLQLGKL